MPKLRRVHLFGFKDSSSGPLDINSDIFERSMVPKFDFEALDFARREALKSHCHRKHHGVVICDRGGNIIASGYNGENRGNSLFRAVYSRQYSARTLHAEFAALSKIPRSEILDVLRLRPTIENFHGARVYSYRIRERGLCANSRPCEEICWPTLARLGFRDAVYIFRDLGGGGGTFIAHELF